MQLWPSLRVAADTLVLAAAIFGMTRYSFAWPMVLLAAVVVTLDVLAIRRGDDFFFWVTAALQLLLVLGWWVPIAFYMLGGYSGLAWDFAIGGACAISSTLAAWWAWNHREDSQGIRLALAVSVSLVAGAMGVYLVVLWHSLTGG